MVNIIHLDDIDSVLKMLGDIEADNYINRYRSNYLFRGLQKESYHLETTLKRNCKDKQHFLESSILRYFRKYAEIADPKISESVWRQMIIGQHHGLPTRLLDWTYSPLVALHFAISDTDFEHMEDNNSVIWMFDITEINSMLPIPQKETLKRENAYTFTVDMLGKMSLEDYDNNMKNTSFVVLEPPSIDQRIISQFSFFTVIPAGIDNIEEFFDKKTNNTFKYVINKSIKWELRDLLDQMNTNERTLFPGYDGIASSLKRYYYVK